VRSKSLQTIAKISIGRERAWETFATDVTANFPRLGAGKTALGDQLASYISPVELFHYCVLAQQHIIRR
jgi:hypothetical protein